MLKYINLTIVFFMELAMLTSFALYGYSIGNKTWMSITLALVFPAAAIMVWGIWCAPKSAHRLKMPYQIFFRLVMFLLASWSLYNIGKTTPAVLMAVLALLTQIVSYFTEKEHPSIPN